MHKVLSVLIIYAFGCGGDPRLFGPQYNLALPIYVKLEDKLTIDGKPSFPHPDEWRQALQDAIRLANGRVTQDENASQRITLYSTDSDKCQNRNVFAFTNDHSWDRIAICHSIIVVNEKFFSALERKTDLMIHELGHALGGHGGHIGGDDIPIDKCPHVNIMVWNLRCHFGLTQYVGADRDYVCESANTINGVCS